MNISEAEGGCKIAFDLEQSPDPYTVAEATLPAPSLMQPVRHDDRRRRNDGSHF